MDSKTPSDPKRPTPPSDEPGDAAWISPRLREKLGDPDPSAPREGPPAWLGILLAVLVIGGGAALFVVMRTGAAQEKATAERIARERAAAAAAESLANVARIDSMRTAAAERAIADSIAGRGAWSPEAKRAAADAERSAAAARSGAGRPAAGAGGAAAATPPAEAEPAAPKVVEKGPFGINVGSFIAAERAASELERLSASTGLKGRVVTRNEDGGEMYLVVLGSFDSRSAAVSRAEALLRRALVNQAQPLSLAP